MARRSRGERRQPIRQTGRLLYQVPSFSGSTDDDGDLIEYTVDLEPFEVWRRVPKEIEMTDGSTREIVIVKRVLQPFACTCPDFIMRPLHPCKHLEAVVCEFFQDYLVYDV